LRPPAALMTSFEGMIGKIEQCGECERRGRLITQTVMVYFAIDMVDCTVERSLDSVDRAVAYE